MNDCPLPRIVADQPPMGVYQAMLAAAARGFRADDPTWINFGQGQPELAPLPDGGVRPRDLVLEARDEAYAPVGGNPALRDAIATLANHRFRSGRAPYAGRHVAVAGGGRVALSRCFEMFGRGRVGHVSPDYPGIAAGIHRRAATTVPVRFPGAPDGGFLPSPDSLERAFAQGLDAFVMSHPNNPTGERWADEDLARVVAAARRHGTLLVLDEFYGTYVYREAGDERSVSALEHVVDPDRDPVVIVDGLTKSLRHPGWRVAWMIGPPAVVECAVRIGGALDGGANALLQRVALDGLVPDAAEAEARAVRRVFREKRDVLVAGLRALGMHVPEPAGTFYAFADLRGLPPGLRDADAFFEAALTERIVTVPGRRFEVGTDAHPADPAVLEPWLRFSFGPPLSAVAEGLTRLRRVVERFGR